VKVLDGNTIVVTPYGDPLQVRIACIHSPQLHQGTARLAAKATLESLLQPGA
jgi:endonuclease YncB( thermonuclease family)